jgi:hypothetical protein
MVSRLATGVAGNIIAQQMGGVPVARDVLSAEDGTHDLDIELPDGHRIPIEVATGAKAVA